MWLEIVDLFDQQGAVLTSEYGGEWLRPDVGEISCMPRMSVGLAKNPTPNL